MAPKGEKKTEIKLVRLDDSSSGESSASRPATASTLRYSRESQDSAYRSPQDSSYRPPPQDSSYRAPQESSFRYPQETAYRSPPQAPSASYWQQASFAPLPGESPPETPYTGGGGALPRPGLSLHPPRASSHTRGAYDLVNNPRSSQASHSQRQRLTDATSGDSPPDSPHIGNGATVQYSGASLNPARSAPYRVGHDPRNSSRSATSTQWQRQWSTEPSAESPPGTPLPGRATPSGAATPSSLFPVHPPRASSYSGGPYTRSNSPYSFSSPYQSQDTLRPLFPDAAATLFKKEWVKDGSIAQLHTRDDHDFWRGWKRHLFYLAPILTILSVGSYWLYFILRINFVLSAQRKLGAVFPLAWIFISVEICVAVPILMQSFWTLFALKKRRRPKLRLVGNDVPTVDVLITCCGEDDDLIIDTTRAACDIDYPLTKFRVVVMDDGKSATLEQAVNDLSKTCPNLYYKARPKYPGVPHHFKAGNLNYGLEHVQTLPGGAGQFVAALDADMIPEQHWLRAVMPHLLVDPKMALACPPQLFYNTPPADPLCQSLDFFVHVSEPIKDALGVAWCTGSGYVVRREALEEIGNFPLGSLAEDVATSTLMLGKGWKTAYVHEPLQFGTVPEDYGSHLKQRTRWAIGTVDTSIKLNFCLYGEKIKQLTFAQRTSSFLYAFLSLFNILLTISLFAMPAVLVAGKPLVAYANDEELRWLIRACFLAMFTNRLTEFVLFIPSGYFTGQRGSRYQIWMSPYIAICLIRSFVLPKWLGGQTQAFKPTGSIKSALNERDKTHRQHMYRRVWTILINYMAWFHLLYVYFVLVAVVLASYRCFLNYGTRTIIVCLLTHAFWPPLTWVIVCSAFWIPITYAVDPPNVPHRETLLNRDPKTGIAHPTPESKKIAFRPQSALFEFEYTFTTLFTTLVFVASFFF